MLKSFLIKRRNVIENGNQELFFFKNMQFADTGHSFDALLLYGHEFSLTIFDVLVFSFVDLLVQDYLIAAIITFFVGKVTTRYIEMIYINQNHVHELV